MKSIAKILPSFLLPNSLQPFQSSVLIKDSAVSKYSGGALVHDGAEMSCPCPGPTMSLTTAFRCAATNVKRCIYFAPLCCLKCQKVHLFGPRCVELGFPPTRHPVRPQRTKIWVCNGFSGHLSTHSPRANGSEWAICRFKAILSWRARSLGERPNAKTVLSD